MKTKIITVFVLLLALNGSARAQSTAAQYPNIGDPIIDFTFSDLMNYNGKQINTRELNGKWLILDFWGKHCAGCIASFSKMDSLQRMFKDEVQLVMVGISKPRTAEARAETKAIFRDKEKKYGLQFTGAFDDEAFDAFRVIGFPLILVIDPAGKVVAKTYTLDSAKLSKLIKRQPFSLRYSPSKGEKTFDLSLPVLTNGKQGSGGQDTAFLFRSLLANWNELMPEYYIQGFQKIGPDHGNTAQVFGLTASELCKVANMGQTNWAIGESGYRENYPFVIIESTDPKIKAIIGSKTRYAYSLTVPGSSGKIEERGILFKEDLVRYFGLKTKVEKRSVPVYSVQLSDPEKFKRNLSKHPKLTVEKIGVSGGVVLKGAKMDELIFQYANLEFLRRIKTKDTYLLPTFDDTGVDYRFDLTIKADMDDLDAVLSALAKAGIEIKTENKMMNCVVVY